MKNLYLILLAIFLCYNCKQIIHYGDYYYTINKDIHDNNLEWHKPEKEPICHSCYRIVNEIFKKYYIKQEFNER